MQLCWNKHLKPFDDILMRMHKILLHLDEVSKKLKQLLSWLTANLYSARCCQNHGHLSEVINLINSFVQYICVCLQRQLAFNFR